MKVYIVMKFYHEMYHVGNVYAHYQNAKADADQDKMGFDYVEECEVVGLP